MTQKWVKCKLKILPIFSPCYSNITWVYIYMNMSIYTKLYDVIIVLKI